MGGLTWPVVVWAFTTFYKGYWIPLTWLSYMTDVSVAGPGPAMFHATNIALHAANVAVRRLPDWESARLNYAMALAQTNQPGEAIRQSGEVLRINPSNALARRALGR